MIGERYLLDSNIVIYHATDKRLITAEVWDILNDTNNGIYVPSKCVEELIHLRQSERIKVKPWKSADDIIGYIKNEMRYGIHYVQEGHLKTLSRLQLFPDHRDPTDRIIIAQAIAEGMFIISSDRKFHDYRPLGLNFVFNKR
jgi:PIN domain nuclease of toxin-antitoxin system